MSYDIFCGLLKAFPLHSPTLVSTQAIINFAYDNHCAKIDTLKSKYPLETIAGYGSDFAKAKNMLHWVSNHTYHNGYYASDVSSTALDLLAYAYDKGSDHGVNCAALSTILTECLLAIGLSARTVLLMPCSPYDGDNHVVTQVYCKEWQKWVMLDPTLNTYMSNENRDVLSVIELRNHLADQKPIYFNAEAQYNDEPWTTDSVKENTTYFAKNLFYLGAYEQSPFNDDADSNRFVLLCPNGYDPKATRINNIEYRIRTQGDTPAMQKWLEHTKREEVYYCTPADFEKTPC